MRAKKRLYGIAGWPRGPQDVTTEGTEVTEWGGYRVACGTSAASDRLVRHRKVRIGLGQGALQRTAQGGGLNAVKTDQTNRGWDSGNRMQRAHRVWRRVVVAAG